MDHHCYQKKQLTFLTYSLRGQTLVTRKQNELSEQMGE